MQKQSKKPCQSSHSSFTSGHGTTESMHLQKSSNEHSFLLLTSELRKLLSSKLPGVMRLPRTLAGDTSAL